MLNISGIQEGFVLDHIKAGMSCTQDEMKKAVECGYCLDGAAVQVYEEGCAARFLVQNGQIAEITLQARSYEETAESGLVLPRLQAMAAMEAAGLEGRELLLGYQDSGGGTVTAGWIAR